MVRVIALIVVLGGMGLFFFGGGVESVTSSEMRRMEPQVYAEVQRTSDKIAIDAAHQYDIAKRNGTKMDACSSASYAVAAYLQAKDEFQYRHWKEVEIKDCRLAGVPMPK